MKQPPEYNPHLRHFRYLWVIIAVAFLRLTHLAMRQRCWLLIMDGFPRCPLRFRFGMAILSLAMAALCPALSADPVPIKGKSGPVIVFDIQKITATGFVGVRKDNGQTLTVPWQRVDLDWLQ